MKDIVFKTLMLKGESGSSIVSFAKTSTTGSVDTYTVTFSDGTEATFEVTNGSSIASIEKTSTTGTVDTYTITLTNGDTDTFEVTNGESYEVPTNGVILFDGSTAPEGYELISNPLSGATSSLNFAKKVSDTNVKGYGNIIDSFNTGDDRTTNAPSIAAVEKRTDNNLLINGELTSQQDISMYIEGETYSIKTSLLGWTTPLSSSNSGLLIPSSGLVSFPTTLSQYWYDSHQVDELKAAIPYLTFSFEYKVSGGSWNKVAKTFNIEEATSSTEISLVTVEAMTISLKPLVGGMAQVRFNQAPNSDVYIRNVKLERGTSATEFKQDMSYYSAMRAALEAAANRYEARVIRNADDIDTLEDHETYKANDTVNFVYYGGCYWAPISGTLKKEVSFNLPLAKPVTLPIGSTMPTITLNEVVTDEGYDLTNILSVESVEFDINSSDSISNYAILRLSYQIVQEPIDMENIHGIKADIDVTFA